MKTILAAAALSAIIAGSAAAATTPSAGPAPAVGSVFDDLAGLGFDLGKFRPDYAGRFPYRLA